METHPIATSPNGEMTLAEFVEHKLPKVTGPYVRVKEAILGDCFGGNAGLFMTKEE